MAEFKQRGRPPKGNKGVFTKDCKYNFQTYKISFEDRFSRSFYFFLVRLLMYGFGDEPDPAPDTVNVMEELVNDYITEMVL